MSNLLVTSCWLPEASLPILKDRIFLNGGNFDRIWCVCYVHDENTAMRLISDSFSMNNTVDESFENECQHLESQQIYSKWK